MYITLFVTKNNNLQLPRWSQQQTKVLILTKGRTHASRSIRNILMRDSSQILMQLDYVNCGMLHMKVS